MFKWHPHMINSGSVNGVNPEFKYMPGNLSLILSFLEDMYSSSPKNNVFWGYDPGNPEDQAAARNMTVVYKNSSGGCYPSKEDFVFSNRKLLKAGIDGYPVGDLNWFPNKLMSWKVQRDSTFMGKMLLKGKKAF
jgi:hypothetical protein